MAQNLVDSESGPATVPGPATQGTVPAGQEKEMQETVERATLTNERAGQSLVDQGIGIMVAVIVVGAVAIPVINDVITNMNTSEMGMAGNIMEYVPLALALGLFVAAISIVR